MGQHRLQPLMGVKHHHLNNAAYMRKLLIWSLGIVLPFLVLFCIFPSGASLYKPSYNRIVVNQLQIPTPRIQTGLLESKLSSDADEEKLQINVDDHSSSDGDGDDDDDDSTFKNIKKQGDAITATDIGRADRALPKATKKQSGAEATEALRIDIDRPLQEETKAKEQSNEMMEESSSADEGDHSTSKAKKQSDGDEKEKQSDASPMKAKKRKDGERSDDFSSEKAKKQTLGDGDEREINVFVIEEEQNGELIEETQKKKKNAELNAESETKKNIKKGKITEKMPEVELSEALMPELELDEALSISGKKEEDQPNIAEVEITKSTKKAKAMDEFGETELNVEEPVARKKKADRNDEGSSKPSRKERAFADEEEEHFSILGKESSLEEFTNSKQSTRKAMGTSYDKEGAPTDEVDEAEREVSFSGEEALDEEDGFTQIGKTNKSSAKSRKFGVDGKSFAEDHETDAFFLKAEDNEVFFTKPKKKKKRMQSSSELEEMEDGDITKQYLPGKCSYFKGKWSMDSNYPPYKEKTCPWESINDEQKCKTTRKTSAWRWKPNECSLKRFRADSFLKLMQGKAVAFVGDKMVKAQLKSLVCLLAVVEIPSLLYNDKINQSMSWHFSSSNVTLSLIWSPYLVQQTSEGQYSKLQLDKLDTKWAEMVPILDVLVLGVGTQFIEPTLYKVKDDVVGCYSCQDLSTQLDITNLKEISFYSGFRAAMRSSIMGIGALPGYNGIVLFLQPFGFEGNRSYYGVSLNMMNIQEEELEKAHSRGSISNQSIMEVLHTYLNNESNHDPIKGLYSPTCLIPSPLANMWNQVLQHTLTQTFSLESDTLFDIIK